MNPITDTANIVRLEIFRKLLIKVSVTYNEAQTIIIISDKKVIKPVFLAKLPYISWLKVLCENKVANIHCRNIKNIKILNKFGFLNFRNNANRFKPSIIEVKITNKAILGRLNGSMNFK
jgi:hypothetical protein